MSENRVRKETWQASESPGFLLWNLENLWQRQQRRALAPFDLTAVQFLLLSGLADVAPNTATLSQIDLARRCRTDPMMTSQVVRTLAGAGLLERIRDSQDKRVFAVRLSEAGRILLARAEIAVRAVEADFFAGLGPDLTVFSDALRFLAGERPRRRVQAVSRSA
ncbi:MAG: hypothetical protein CFH10_02304 [Alphaproteobacteria bacterium MarineAlpha4_Bin2]|nr:MAG: hypothetical protein CFH10_02304 [Alphaproteobacteria bacterium MarineAlpha4_Bin2]